MHPFSSTSLYVVGIGRQGVSIVTRMVGVGLWRQWWYHFNLEEIVHLAYNAY